MLATLIRTVYVILIAFSIVVTYHVMINQQNYEIITNPEGPDTSDYFE